MEIRKREAVTAAKNSHILVRAPVCVFNFIYFKTTKHSTVPWVRMNYSTCYFNLYVKIGFEKLSSLPCTPSSLLLRLSQAYTRPHKRNLIPNDIYSYAEAHIKIFRYDTCADFICKFYWN